MAEEKKKGGFWSKMKQSFSDSNRESKLQDAFRSREDVKELTIYPDSGLLSAANYYGYFDGEDVVIYGSVKDEDIPYSAILSTNPTDSTKELPKRYYVTGKAEEEITLTIEEKDENDNPVKNAYQHAVTRLHLDSNVLEVEVIKVKNTYYQKLKK